jgi:UDP-N-acetylmuramate-alanine ligase
MIYNIPHDGYAILNADDKNINKLVEICDSNIIFYTNLKNNLNNLFNNKLLSNRHKNNGKIIFIDNNNNNNNNII